MNDPTMTPQFWGFHNQYMTPVDPMRTPAGTNLWHLGMQYVPADLRLSADEMLSVSAVYAAVRAIVDPLAASDWVPFVIEGGQRTNLPDSNLHYLLNVRPDDDLPAMAAKEILLTQCLLHGDGYAVIDRDSVGRIVAITPLWSTQMLITRDPDTEQLLYRYRQYNGASVDIPADDILHIRGPCVRGLAGDSIVYRAASAIALARAQELYSQTYFTNGAALGGYVKVPGIIKDPNEVEMIKADFQSKHGGVRNAHLVGILQNNAEFVQLSTDAEKAQLVQSRQFGIEEVARYFGVPLVFLGVAASAQGYGTNISQLYQGFYRHTLYPWSKRIAGEVQYKLLPRRAPWPQIEVDLRALTRGDDKERAEAREVLIRSGQMTPNEARHDEGRDSMPGGDVLLVDGRYTTVEALVEQAAIAVEKAKNPPPAPPPPPQADPEAEPTEPDATDASEPAEPAEPEPSPADKATATNLMAAALDRHLKRSKARRTDLERSGKTPEVVAENLATLRPKAVEELTALAKLARLKPANESMAVAIESVEAGVAPEKAAAHLVG